jgi:hypothetical protein
LLAERLKTSPRDFGEENDRDPFRRLADSLPRDKAQKQPSGQHDERHEQGSQERADRKPIFELNDAVAPLALCPLARVLELVLGHTVG